MSLVQLCSEPLRGKPKKPCVLCGALIEHWQRQRCSACRKQRYATMTKFGAKARSLVAKAIKDGFLRSLADGLTNCIDCGAVAREYDHRDYDHPLVVQPVCRRCNIVRGPAKQPAAYIAEHPRALKVASP